MKSIIAYISVLLIILFSTYAVAVIIETPGTGNTAKFLAPFRMLDSLGNTVVANDAYDSVKVVVWGMGGYCYYAKMLMSDARIYDTLIEGQDFFCFMDDLQDIDSTGSAGTYGYDIRVWDSTYEWWSPGQIGMFIASPTSWEEQIDSLAKMIDSLQAVLNSIQGGVTLADNAITAAKIANDAIGAPEIAANAITQSELATDAIGADQIASNAIGAFEIADGAIDAGAIAANAIGTSEIVAAVFGAIADSVWDKIYADAINVAGGIGDSLLSILRAERDTLNAILDSIQAVVGVEVIAMANDVITAAVIATNAIGGDEIAVNAISSSEIAENAIGNSELAVNAITSDQIAVQAIGASEIAPDAIGVSEIAAAVFEEIWRNIDTLNIDTSEIGKWFITAIIATLADSTLGDISALANRGVAVVAADTFSTGDTAAVMPNDWVADDSTAYQGPAAGLDSENVYQAAAQAVEDISTNFVRNGNFEMDSTNGTTAPAYWTLISTDSARIVPSTVNGRRKLHLMANQNDDTLGIYQCLGVLRPGQYLLSGFIKTNHSTNAKAWIVIGGGTKVWNTGFVDSIRQGTSTTEYEFYKIVTIDTDTLYSIGLLLTAQVAGYYAEFDKVQFKYIEPLGTDSTAMLALAEGHPSVFYGPAGSGSGSKTYTIYVADTTGVGGGGDTAYVPGVTVSAYSLSAVLQAGMRTDTYGKVTYSTDLDSLLVVISKDNLYADPDTILVNVTGKVDTIIAYHGTIPASGSPELCTVFLSFYRGGSPVRGVKMMIRNDNMATDTTQNVVIGPYFDKAVTDSLGQAYLYVPKTYLFHDSTMGLYDITLTFGGKVLGDWSDVFIPDQDSLRLVVE